MIELSGRTYLKHVDVKYWLDTAPERCIGKVKGALSVDDVAYLVAKKLREKARDEAFVRGVPESHLRLVKITNIRRTRAGNYAGDWSITLPGWILAQESRRFL